MGLISNGTTLLDAGAIDSGIATGAMTLLATNTLGSPAANISFTSGINSTYKEYVFKIINVHPATNNQRLTVNFRDGSTAYDATKTTTVFTAYHTENDNEAAVEYITSQDLAQATGDQPIIVGAISTDNDSSGCGTLQLFDPSSTTFVKHFIFRGSSVQETGPALASNSFVAGYCNVTAAIDGVQFKFVSGNIDSGTIKMYGIK